MAGGVRLMHPVARNGMLTIENRKRRYQLPVACAYCASFHTVKTYHLVFGPEGETIVSPEILVALSQIEVGPGLYFVPDVIQYANDVDHPPAQIITFGHGSSLQVERHRVGDIEEDEKDV